jgi:hypothetical protein
MCNTALIRDTQPSTCFHLITFTSSLEHQRYDFECQTLPGEVSFSSVCVRAWDGTVQLPSFSASLGSSALCSPQPFQTYCPPNLASRSRSPLLGYPEVINLRGRRVGLEKSSHTLIHSPLKARLSASRVCAARSRSEPLSKGFRAPAG